MVRVQSFDDLHCGVKQSHVKVVLVACSIGERELFARWRGPNYEFGRCQVVEISVDDAQSLVHVADVKQNQTTVVFDQFFFDVNLECCPFWRFIERSGSSTKSRKQVNEYFQLIISLRHLVEQTRMTSESLGSIELIQATSM